MREPRLDATERRVLTETLLSLVDDGVIPAREADTPRATEFTLKTSRYQRALLRARCVEFGRAFMDSLPAPIRRVLGRDEAPGT